MRHLVIAMLLVIAVGAVPGSARAVDCATTIAAVETTRAGDLRVFFTEHWHLVARAQHLAIKERLSLLLGALLAGRRMVFKYPAGYVCEVDNDDTEPTAVRIK